MQSVLITGGSRGIGAALVARLAAEARVVFLNHRASGAEAANVQAAAAGRGSVRVVQADLTDCQAVARMMSEIAEACGRLDVLVHCAAPPLQPRRVTRLDWDADVTPHLDVACRGLLHCVQQGDALLGPGSQIITLLTDALFHRPPVQMGAYLMAKGALWGLSRALAKELQPRGVRVNMVSPAMVSTGLLRHYGERALEIMAQDHPMRRLAEPDEIAAVVAALIEGGGDYLQAANVIVNGGAEF